MGGDGKDKDSISIQEDDRERQWKDGSSTKFSEFLVFSIEGYEEKVLDLL